MHKPCITGKTSSNTSWSPMLFIGGVIDITGLTGITTGSVMGVITGVTMGAEDFLEDEELELISSHSSSSGQIVTKSSIGLEAGFSLLLFFFMLNIPNILCAY